VADSQEDSLYDDVSAMADRLKLTGRERTSYIHEHMTRGGYKAIPSYVRDESEDDDDEDSSGSSFFGGRRRRPTRDQESGGHGTRTRRQRDDDNWY
jgi:hypothetical protein